MTKRIEGGRGEMIQIRVSREEKARMVERASAVGMKLSDWLRHLAMAEIDSPAGGVVGETRGGATDGPSAGRGKANRSSRAHAPAQGSTGGSNPPRQRQVGDGERQLGQPGPTLETGGGTRERKTADSADKTATHPNPAQDEPIVQREGESWSDFMMRRKDALQGRLK